jgi:hypothetical protein
MGLGKSNLHSDIFDNKIECVVVQDVARYLTMLAHCKTPFLQPHFLGSASKWAIQDVSIPSHIQIDGESEAEVTSSRYEVASAGYVKMIVGIKK